MNKEDNGFRRNRLFKIFVVISSSILGLSSLIQKNSIDSIGDGRFVLFISLLSLWNSEFLLHSVLILLWLGLDDTHGNSLSGISLLLLLSGLNSSCFSLLLELGFSDLLLLHLVDGLNKNGLVLELITLGSEIEVMVDISRDLLGFSVLLEKSSEDSLSSHVKDLNGHSCVSGTLSLTETGVSTYNIQFY